MTTAADARNPSRFEAVHADASEQIAKEIRMYIEREGLRPGDRIGTEHELSREFGVSRPTVRERDPVRAARDADAPGGAAGRAGRGAIRRGVDRRAGRGDRRRTRSRSGR